MIFHSANNLKREKEKKRKKEKKKKRKKKGKERKRKRKRKKKRKRKEGMKELKRKAPCNNSNLAIPFKHGQVLFKFYVARLLNKSDQTV
jgi:hypothetical protein